MIESYDAAKKWNILTSEPDIASSDLAFLDEPLEQDHHLFDAGLIQQVPLAEIYDVKAGTSAQRASLDPEHYRRKPDVHNPDDWADELWANTRWEWFAYVLRSCQRVLDVVGRAAFRAHRLPEVVGIDMSPAHIALARNSAECLGLDRVTFEVGDIENLPFPDASFDGVCFGGNVFTYQFDVPRMLREIHRVLRPGGPFAFEQWPVDPDTPAHERIMWFIDGGPPIVHYNAGQGLHDRSYFIYIERDSLQGQRLADLAARMSGLLSDEQRRACEGIVGEIREGNTGIVGRATYSGEHRSIAAAELPQLLRSTGFTDIAYWALPDGRPFAESLQQSGVLDRLTQDDLLLYLRALVASSRRVDCWVEQVTCRKALL